MPHSSFKGKVTDNGAGVGKCPCGQTFECGSKQELAMKHRIDSVAIFHWLLIR